MSRAFLSPHSQKLEIRSTKSETNPNAEIQMTETTSSGLWNISSLVIQICFGFRISNFGFQVLTGLAVAALVFPGSLAAQDRILLRDTKVLTKRVLSFDEDGVRLEGMDQPLGWDEIESGTVSSNQAKFDELVKEVGQDLFRIRLRLKDGNYADILPHAERIFPRYQPRRSPTAYLVSQGLMWAQLAHNQREKAVEPYLVCLDILSAKTKEKPALPGDRKLKFDLVTGLSPELAPVWFDAAAAKAALPGVQKTLAKISNASAGANMYGVTLALSAQDLGAADKLLKHIPAKTPSLAELVDIATAQREVLSGKPGTGVAGLEKKIDQLSEVHKPLAYYWLGLAGLDAADKQLADPKKKPANAAAAHNAKEALVRLLHIPALYGEQHPDLAGAALYQAAKTLDALPDNSASAYGVGRMRTLLLSNYPQTYHGSRLMAELGSKREDSKKEKK
jgi:hypothetical protein